MDKCETNLLKSYDDDPKKGLKTTEQVKDRILQCKVSEGRLRELDYWVDNTEKYDSRSDLIRQAIDNELDGGELELPEELWNKIYRIKRRGNYPSYKVVVHEIVKSAQKRYEEKYGIEVNVE